MPCSSLSFRQVYMFERLCQFRAASVTEMTVFFIKSDYQSIRDKVNYESGEKRDFHRSYLANLTSTMICTTTGDPPFIAGLNFQPLTASIAFLSKEGPRLFTT